MNIALWIAAGLLAATFAASGLVKVSRSKEDLMARMPFVEDFSAAQVRAIGVVEVAGAVGVILPGITKIAPMLVPLAATGLAITMVLAAVVHIRRGEARQIAPNVVLFALAAFVAWGRFGPYAF